MTWFRVDDSFHSHPKVLAADAAALGLWVVAGTWCAANLTDGFVPDYVLPRLLPDAVLLAESLVTCRLWRRARGGYRFHDWADYNPSSEEVNKDREAARKRMRDLRAKRREPIKTAGQTVNGSAEQLANVPENFAGSSQPRPDPSRPVPKGRVVEVDLQGGRAVAREEPPSKCLTHLEHPDPPPCGACGDARRTRERWDREQAAAASAARQAEAHSRAEVNRLAIGACRLCDAAGRLPGGAVCHHDPGNAERATRGAAAARASLAGRTP